MNNSYDQAGWANAAHVPAANIYNAEPYPQSRMSYGEENMVYAMAYVKTQPWGETYDDEIALNRGTIFPALDFPWLVREGGSAQ